MSNLVQIVQKNGFSWSRSTCPDHVPLTTPPTPHPQQQQSQQIIIIIKIKPPQQPHLVVWNFTCNDLQPFAESCLKHFIFFLNVFVWFIRQRTQMLRLSHSSSSGRPIETSIQKKTSRATLERCDIRLWFCWPTYWPFSIYSDFSFPSLKLFTWNKAQKPCWCAKALRESQQHGWTLHAWGENGVLYVALPSTGPQSRHHLRLSPESCWPTSVLHPSVPPSTSALHVAQRRPRPRLTFAAVCRQALSYVPSEGGGGSPGLTDLTAAG